MPRSECRCALQALLHPRPHPSEHLKVKQNHPPPPKSSQNSKNALSLARFLNFQFPSCLWDEAILTHKGKSKLILFNITNPKSSSLHSSKPPPHMHISFFSVFNMCHSLKSLGDKFAGTPDENTCRIIFNTVSFHISSSLHRKKKKDKPGLKIFA